MAPRRLRQDVPEARQGGRLPRLRDGWHNEGPQGEKPHRDLRQPPHLIFDARWVEAATAHLSSMETTMCRDGNIRWPCNKPVEMQRTLTTHPAGSLTRSDEARQRVQ